VGVEVPDERRPVVEQWQVERQGPPRTGRQPLGYARARTPAWVKCSS
jgi:hypothetical protein